MSMTNEAAGDGWNNVLRQDARDEHGEQSDGNSTCLADKRQVLDLKVRRKLDCILLPFLALLFLFNSLDRSNIGNAETADFTKDIGVQPEDLNTAIQIFFLFFVALQPIGAALGRKYGMSHWVIPCMAIWGICTCLHAFISSKWQLYLLRAIIGTLEAGFYPTAVAYLSLFYTRYEFARRLGMFYGQYCIAGAFGGMLSYFVFTSFPRSDPGTSSGWQSWQILFGLEGAATIVLAGVGYFWLPRSANTAWFLKARERWWAEKRIELDQGDYVVGDEGAQMDMQEQADVVNQILGQDADEGHELLPRSASSGIKRRREVVATSDRGLSVDDIVEAVGDWKLWYLLVCNILSAIPVTAFSIFLPLVLKPLTTSPALANLLTAPPYLLGAVILYLFSHWSDSSRQRIVPILWSLGLLMLGLTGVVVLSDTTSALRYTFLCILLGGTFVASPLTIAWFTSNLPEVGKRSIVLGINGWGNLAGVFSSMIFQPRFGPSYTLPFIITLALVTLSFIGYAYFQRLVLAENKRRKSLVEEWTEAEVLAELHEGAGPVKQSHGEMIYAVIAWYCRRFRMAPGRKWKAQGGRRGDEKLTFQYGL